MAQDLADHKQRLEAETAALRSQLAQQQEAAGAAEQAATERRQQLEQEAAALRQQQLELAGRLDTFQHQVNW
jgi:predicted  nucleic acid-binding Zn-ribbon protein